MRMNRRSFSLSGGALTLAFLIDGKILHLSPAQAQTQNLPLGILTKKDADALDFLGDAIDVTYGTGDSALHHYGVWPRLHEEDFRVKSRYGRGLDWPISYGDLPPCLWP